MDISRDHSALTKSAMVVVAMLLGMLGAKAADVQSVSSTQLEIIPANPHAGDLISVRLSGEWLDACVPMNPEVSVSGQTIRIDTFNAGVCIQVPTPWELTTLLGVLPPGTYQVDAFYNAELEPIATGGFQVSGDAVSTHRSNWVPNVGVLAPSERPLGDLWRFNCPRGGVVNILLDTSDDSDTGRSHLDPLVEVVDGRGQQLARGSDESDCSYPPLCGGACPLLANVPCGERANHHALIVRDAGAASETGDRCVGGGGYRLTVQVFKADGSPLSETNVRLGGGGKSSLPRWAAAYGIPGVGPAIDDAAVPRFD